MVPSSLSFSSTPISTVITFGFSTLPGYFEQPLIRKSDGTLLGSGVITSNGNNLAFTTAQYVSFKDYLMITSDGSWIYPTIGQYFVGGKGSNTIDMNTHADPLYKDTYIAFGNDGDDKIVGTSRYYDTIIAGEGSDIIVDTGGGATINLVENFKKSDTIVITPDALNFEGTHVTVEDFDTSDISKKNSTNDTLNLNSGKIASSSKKDQNGSDVGLIQSHTIKDGVITFTNVPITSDMLYQDALDYLYLNLAVGETVIFNLSTSMLNGMVLYQKGTTNNNAVVIELPDTSNLVLGSKSAQGVMVIVDKSAPTLVGTTAESNTIRLEFNEYIAKMKYDKGLKVLLNGITDIGKVAVSMNKDNTLSISSKTLSLGSSDYVQLLFTAPMSNTVEDKFKNSAQWSKIDGITYSSMIIATQDDSLIDLSAQTLSQFVRGNSGDDVITGSTQSDALWGDAGADTIFGGTGNDTLDGGEGNDTLDGGVGADVMRGGFGDDTYFVNDSGDTLYELITDGGADTVKVSLGTYTLGEYIENLIITASSGASISGNALDNTIYSGAGNDGINGLSGFDTISYALSTTGVVVDLSVTLQQDTKMGKDTLLGFENIAGSEFKDVLMGDANNNTIFGGLEDDSISGGDGDDVLDGGLDNKNGDILNGGNGTDTVSYASATLAVRVDLSTTTAQYTSGGGLDTLSNFENVTGSHYDDLLQGNALTSNVLTGGLGIDRFYLNSKTIRDTISDFGVGNDIIVLDRAVFTSVSSEYVSYSNGVLFYDADGLATVWGPTAFLTLIGVDSFNIGNIQLGSF